MFHFGSSSSFFPYFWWDALPDLIREDFFRLCLRVRRGRDGKALEKMNEQVEEIDEKNGRGELWGVNFNFFIILNHPIWGN